jgi:uncharacterized membrane protein YfcA
MLPQIVVVLMAFVCELGDSSLGMGYGTILTPVLMMFGYEPLQIVHSVLLSELVSGTTAAILHHRLGNVNLHPRSREFKILAIMALCSAFGVAAAVVVAVNIPPRFLKTYIGLLVLAMGGIILLTRGRGLSFAWRKITALGLVAAFNKGMSGGGYGPVVMGGQVLSGVDSKSAVGITSAAEGVACLVGVITFLLTGVALDWSLAPWLLMGSLVAVPVATHAVKRLPTERLRVLVGVVILALGLFTLCKIVF